MRTALLFATCCLLLLRADAQSAQCQSSYNAFDGANDDCKSALNYVNNGNVLNPLSRNLSESDLDTLCSGPAGSDCRSTFLNYFQNCITSEPGLGEPPEFYEGTLDENRLTHLVNAVCRKDCVGREQYCYVTVLRALLNTVCDDVTSTCSPVCQQALDQTGCCGQNVFRTKNSNVESACCLQDFFATCQELRVSCPADLSDSCSLTTTTAPPTSVPPSTTSVPPSTTSVPPRPSPSASPSPSPSASPSPSPSPTSASPSQTVSADSPSVEPSGSAHLQPVATALVIIPVLLIGCLVAACVL